LPYTFTWSNGETTEDIGNLASGIFAVTVADANGCQTQANATVTNIGGPTASAEATDANCDGSNGAVNLTVSGGTLPYTFAWSNGEATEDIDNLTPGIFAVTVADANGCLTTASATVSNIWGFICTL